MGFSGLSRDKKQEWCKIDFLAKELLASWLNVNFTPLLLFLHHECFLFRDEPLNPIVLAIYYTFFAGLSFFSQQNACLDLTCSHCFIWITPLDKYSPAFILFLHVMWYIPDSEYMKRTLTGSHSCTYNHTTTKWNVQNVLIVKVWHGSEQLSVA